MQEELTYEQVKSIRESYYNILALFLDQEMIESRYIRCLLKWAIQLQLSPEDLNKASKDLSTISFFLPEKIDKLEAVYHLVYMIHLDRVVEDVELEVATIYAKKLGFKAKTVSDLFTYIATADYKGRPQDIRNEVVEFLKLQDQD